MAGATLDDLLEEIQGMRTDLARQPRNDRDSDYDSPRRGKSRGSTSFDDIIGGDSKVKASFGKMSDSIDALVNVGGKAQKLVSSTFDYADDKYSAIQKQLGGLAEINQITNDTSKHAVQNIDDIFATFYGNMEASGDLVVRRNGDDVNALNAFYKDASVLGRNYMEIRDELAQRQGLMLNKMGKEDIQKLTMMEKGLQISNKKVSEILERQISLTGEASTKTFDEISAYSSAVAEATGVSYQEIAGQVADIITDVERFGNVQVDEAARIAGALNQLGLSYQGFGGMVDKFMNFDNAAESLGNLTTVFGVHFDAMEMMQLANEDQEEFLHRMRDAFLDSGKAVEDMTLAEKKLAAQQMGMSVQDFENFMQEDRILDDLTADTAAADPADGFQKMTEQMELVKRDSNEMTKFMQNKMMDPLARSAREVSDDFKTMQSNIMIQPEKFLPGYQELQTYLQNTMKGVMGTEEYEESYKSLKPLMLDFIEVNSESLKDADLLRQKIEGMDDPNSEYFLFKDKKSFNMIDVAKMGLDEAGGAAFFKYLQEQQAAVGGQVGAKGAQKILKDMGEDRLSKGLKIDNTIDVAKSISDAIYQIDEQVMNDLIKNPPETFGRSSAPGTGDRIKVGMIPDVESTADSVLKSIKDIDSKVLASTGDIISKNPLVAAFGPGDRKVSIDSLGTAKKMEELNNKAIKAASMTDKSSQEKMNVLTTAVEELSKAVDEISKKENVIQNVLQLDGATIASYLINYRSAGGVAFKTVSTTEVE